MSSYQRSRAAVQDWQGIVEYTLEQHGIAQTEKYTASLTLCMEDIAPGNGHFKDIEVNGRVVRIKHCQKHYIFALIRVNTLMIVIAIFHERMDLISRLQDRLK